MVLQGGGQLIVFLFLGFKRWLLRHLHCPAHSPLFPKQTPSASPQYVWTYH